MLTLAELSGALESARRSLFRLETLDRYEVASDGSDFRRYLDGEPEPTPERKQAWLDYLSAERATGRTRCHLRLVDTTNGLGDYLRYACEWGYAYNGPAGQRVRILDLADTPRPRELTLVNQDFWLVDDREVVLMHYHADGQFEAAEILDQQHVARHRAAAEVGWNLGTDFTTWWAAHPQYHREQHHAV